MSDIEIDRLRARLAEVEAGNDRLRAAIQKVKDLLPDSPPFGHVRVVDVWDALHDVTDHECVGQAPAPHAFYGSGGSQWCDTCGEAETDPIHSAGPRTEKPE